MKYTLLLSILTLSFPLPAHTMEEEKMGEIKLQEKQTKLSSQLDQLAKRDDASPGKIQEILEQLTKTNSALERITKYNESLE